jgi:hypothetical protein
VSPGRLSSATRGAFIAGFLAVYGWFMRQPGPSLEVLFLVGAALQLAVILMRRVVPADYQAEASGIYELLADGASVLLFALGVFNGIAASTRQM